MSDSYLKDEHPLELDYDELKSDNEYIVVDGKDVEALIRRMQENGEDALLALEDDPERILENVEKEIEETTEPVMEYFKEENLSHMPRWAREAFKKGNHKELERASAELAPTASPRRLHVMVYGGPSDCCVQDVAEDYNVPVEFVADILLEHGVKSPQVDDMIKERCSDQEIEALLHLITSFDAQDLADRYSDSTLTELADYYNLDIGAIEEVCEDEGIFCVLGRATRLQRTREDRILDILLHDAPRKKPYPSLLEGLVAPA